MAKRPTDARALPANIPHLDDGALTLATAPKPLKRRGRNLSAILRVSQKAGRDDDGWMAPDQQADAMLATAAANGDQITSWHDETDSVSGGSVDRAGLKAALHEALTGVTDGVIVAKVNRFARTKRAGEALIYDLIEAGSSFVAAFDKIDTAGGKLDRGTEVYLDFLLRQAQWEREDLRSNWADVRRRHVAAGVATRKCYGYEFGPDRRLVPVPKEARWVKRIFEHRAAGKSWSWIATELNRRNVPPPQPLSKKQTPSLIWVPQHATAIVNNRKYLGELTVGIESNPAAHKPIITEDLWEAAHAVRVVGSQDTKAAAEFYMLRGFIRCASCGARMTGDTHHSSTGVVHRYYRCRKYHTWDTCPAPAFISADDIEAEVVADFELRTLGTTATVETTGTALAEAQAAVAAARAEMRAFNERTQALRDEFGDDDFQDGINARAATLRAALVAERDARAAKTGAELPEGVAEDWPTMSDAERAVLLGKTYYCVAVRPTTRHRAQEPAYGRMRLWLVGDADLPANLPGRPIGKRKGPKVESKITPIRW